MNWLDLLLNPATPLGRRSDAYEAACLWDRCAFHEINTTHPGFVVAIGNAPEDKQLIKLGTAFPVAIRLRQRRRAIEIYLAIRKRVLVLGARKIAL